MKVILFGSTGKVGLEVYGLLREHGVLVKCSTADLTKPHTIPDVIRKASPDFVINAAAYNEVDLAETDRSTATKVNTSSPFVMAEEAKKRNIPFIHYSSDFVFDGKKGSPYTESDERRPLSFYGRSKLSADMGILSLGSSAIILRTAWVYADRRKNFVSTILGLAEKREKIRVVDDQIGSPTWARDLAEITCKIVGMPKGYIAERSGLFNFAGVGSASRFELAKTALEIAYPGIEHNILPVKTSEIPKTLATRPENTTLDCSKVCEYFDIKIDDWRDSLRKALTT